MRAQRAGFGRENGHTTLVQEGSGPVTPFVDGRLLVDTDGFDPLFVLDAASGAKLAEIDSSIVAAAAGGKAFVEQVHTLHAIDIATGVSAWAFDVPGLLTVPPIATEDFVVTLEGTGRLSALNRMTGALVRSYTLPGPTSSSLQGSTRGMGAGEGLLVVPFDTVLYAF